MRFHAFALAAVCTAALALVLGLGLTSRAQEPPAGPVYEPALGVLASTGHRTPAVTFLEHLGRSNPSEKAGGNGLSLFVPGPEQLLQYGDKHGVITFLNTMPKGAGVVQILVRDTGRLERVADKSQTAEFLKAVANRGGAVELFLVDLPGLARHGSRDSLIGFARRLPAGSLVHLYATPRQLSFHGDDADVLAFLDALRAPVEFHLDDPFLPALLQAWVAADQARAAEDD